MKKRNLFLLIVLVGCMVVPTAFGVSDSQFPEGPRNEPGMGGPEYLIFVKFGGIDGEVIHAQHKGWCESIAFEHGLESKNGLQKSRRMMQSIMKPFVITKFMDRATPKLNEAALKGKIFPLITVNLVRKSNGGFIFMQYIFKNAVVTSVSISGEPMHGPPIPLEKVQFRSEEITWKYMAPDPMGKSTGIVKFTWKVE